VERNFPEDWGAGIETHSETCTE